MLKQTIEKEDGYGPYFLVLSWCKHDRPQDDPMIAVFSTYEDLNAFREKIVANGNVVHHSWELAVDHTRRAG